MVDRSHKPSALASTPTFPPQAAVAISDDNSRVTATLPTGESAEILLFGATVISWKSAAGVDRLWLSDAAKLDGSKPVRGGIPLVFPVFGTAPDHKPTAGLASHGFARASRWEFLGKSTSEGRDSSSVKLDFGLSSASLDEKTRKEWPYDFSLVYSVSLDRASLSTSMVVTNQGDKPMECQLLFHSYFRVKDIANVEISGLEGASFVDKVDGAKTKTLSANAPVTFSGEMDRVVNPEGDSGPIVISEDGEQLLSITRDNLEDVVLWNPWQAKAADMGDFYPKSGWKEMVCVEAGSVRDWQRLEPGDAFTGAQTITVE